VSIELKAVIGLGNPGTEHARTRHNAGFWFADALVGKFGGSFRKEARFHSLMAETAVGSQRLVVLKPQTWMNDSGRAVQALMAFHKLAPDQILIAHDELDLPPGVARLKIGGGHGGHNGLRDTHEQIGADYRRLRIGVGHPGEKHLVTNYLTSGRASAADQQLIDEAIAAAVEAMPLALENWNKATHQLHSRPSPLPAQRGEG
jgi:peptidyl-tRNA hydrolase, PTH1 family